MYCNSTMLTTSGNVQEAWIFATFENSLFLIFKRKHCSYRGNNHHQATRRSNHQKFMNETWKPKWLHTLSTNLSSSSSASLSSNLNVTNSRVNNVWENVLTSKHWHEWYTSTISMFNINICKLWENKHYNIPCHSWNDSRGGWNALPRKRTSPRRVNHSLNPTHRGSSVDLSSQCIALRVQYSRTAQSIRVL